VLTLARTGAGTATPRAVAAPQPPQNLDVGVHAKPHEAQLNRSASPQFSQYRLDSGFAV
jgi:hypothetical protein